jgi:hypothetical protein
MGAGSDSLEVLREEEGVVVVDVGLECEVGKAVVLGIDAKVPVAEEEEAAL